MTNRNLPSYFNKRAVLNNEKFPGKEVEIYISDAAKEAVMYTGNQSLDMNYSQIESLLNQYQDLGWNIQWKGTTNG